MFNRRNSKHAHFVQRVLSASVLTRLYRLALGLGVAVSAHADGDSHAVGSVFRDCEFCPEMVVIPSGAFVLGTMGSSDENREHPAESDLTLIELRKDFAMGRHEITRKEFSAFADETRFQQRTECRTWDFDRVGFALSPEKNWRSPEFPKRVRDNHPITCVDWFDARAYTTWLSKKTGATYRLPSETEWEYAAKAGTQTLRHWGHDPFDGCDYANTFDLTAEETYPLAWNVAPCRDGYADLAPVGSLQPNAFGLFDMIGNVWEWVEDCSSKSYIGRPKDERAWVWAGCERRIQRGGSWITSPARSRSSYHGDGRPGDRAVFFGFRVVREIQR